MELTIASSVENDVVTLKVAGEVDVANADVLRDKIDEAMASGIKQLNCDMSQLSYIDSTGIGVLVGAATRAEEKSVQFKVCYPQPNVLRVLTLLGVDKQLQVVEA